MDIHAYTPQLSVIDNRGLPLRQVAYWRRDIDQLIPEVLVTISQHNTLGHLVAQRDPRFLAPTARPNLSAVYSLSGKVLLSDSVDAGWALGLQDEIGQQQARWDGRGTHWQHEYDEQRRLIATHEQTPGTNRRTVERLTYADNGAEFAERNQCGQLIRQDDRAGCLWLNQQALSGGLIRQTRRFLPEHSDVHADWPDDEADRDVLLQPGEGYVTQNHFGPLGEVLVQTDAAGHRQRFSVDRAGQLQRIDLSIKSLTPQPLLKAAHYNAEGQLLIQITGNDVTSSATYEASTGRLKRLTATTLKRERLQDLSYEYDPVGNILRLVDDTQPVTFFANQRVAPENTYSYDSLYQLTCATGRETANAGQNPGLPELIIPSPIDPGRLLNYTEHYEYDVGGNRTKLRHVSDKNPFRQLMRVDQHSNRALPWNEGDDEPDFTRAFDANGNQRRLVPGAQPMVWDALNQLQGVTTVRRSTVADDGDWYRYNAAGERAVKFSSQQTHAVIHQRVVHYLPGLEVRTTDGDEELQVICVPLARGSVRCLHWVKGKRSDIEADQLRYSVDDHVGSCSLELDKHAAVISHEGYFPYGGTAWWAARSKVDADYKTIRYSGKERDACGLYYYGFRYYAPWLGRWVNPDPAGNIDGLNLYKMVGNNPVAYKDLLGQTRTVINKDIHNIWVGEEAGKLAAHVNNINNTVEQAGGYKVHLYLDSAVEDTYSNIVQELKVHNVIYLRGSELFSDFQKSETATIYNDFRSGDPKNFAFAVDVLRMHVVEKMGGMYSDIDDLYLTKTRFGLSEEPLMASANELLTLPPMVIPWENILSSSSVQINNSSFAAHPGNPILKDVMAEMTVRYNNVVESEKYPDKDKYISTGILAEQPNERMRLMSSIVGPRVLTDVITRHDDSMIGILSAMHPMYLSRKPNHNLLRKVHEKMPLGYIIKTGTLKSWQ